MITLISIFISNSIHPFNSPMVTTAYRARLDKGAFNYTANNKQYANMVKYLIIN